MHEKFRKKGAPKIVGEAEKESKWAKKAYDWFRVVRYEGRNIDKDGVNYILYKNDTIHSLGWNMYMTPEQAARGILLFEDVKATNEDTGGNWAYKDLSGYKIFKR